MIIVRFQQTFPLRISEWLMSGILLSWGITLLYNPVIFDAPQNYALARLATQPVWGWLCLVMGAVRWVALTINGAWRASPHIRMVCAFLSCFFWLQISLGIAGSAIVSTGIAVYPWFLLLDSYNTFRAATDARAADDRAKAGISSH